MDLEPTQEATQPQMLSSGVAPSIHDAEDIICILQPTSLAAMTVVENLASLAPQHVLFQPPDRPTLIAIPELPDDKLPDNGAPLSKVLDSHQPLAQISTLPQSRSIALRMSSKLLSLPLGFVFGRDAANVDIPIHSGLGDQRISSRHCRVYLNDHGVLMAEDQSTNGTWIDRQWLSCRNPNACKQALSEGSTFALAVTGDPQTRVLTYAEFTVVIPQRDAAIYARNLQSYMRSIAAARCSRDPTLADALRDPAKSHIMAAPTISYNHGIHWSGYPKYKIDKKIGQGGFAAVYRMHSRDGQVFAVKEVDTKRIAKANIGQKLDSELKIMKDISHPYIVRLVDSHMYDQWIYLIMEFMPGGDLSAYIAENQALPEFEVRIMAQQLCQALAYLHARGITHRDIKPENILVHSTEPLTVKLSDFGLSKKVHDKSQSMLKTFCGTLLYCAPEVYPDFSRMRRGLPSRPHGASKTLPYQSNVDIWSLGAVFYQFLMGLPPIKGESHSIDMLRAILKEDIDWDILRADDVRISEQAIDLLQKMLQIDPETRITAVDASAHRWLQKRAPNSPPDLWDNAAAAVSGQSRTMEGNVAERSGQISEITPSQGVRKLVSITMSRLLDDAPRVPALSPRVAAAAPIASRLVSPPATPPPFERVGPANGMTGQALQSQSPWSPREPRPVTTGSDSGEMLADFQRAADMIAGGQPLSGSEEELSSRSKATAIDDQGPIGQSGQDSSSFGLSAEIEGMRALTQLRETSDEYQLPARRLFGEVTASGRGESGIFGNRAPPTIARAEVDEDQSQLEAAEEGMSDLRVTSMLPTIPSAENMDLIPLQPAPLKRVLQASPGSDEDASISKRSMTHDPRILVSQAVTVTSNRLPDLDARLATANGQSRPLASVSPPARLGTLTPVAGSFSTETLHIDHFIFAFGRGLNATHRWPDKDDTRIAKGAIDIVFFHPSLAGDGPFDASWHEQPGLYAAVLTRSRRGICVNGTRLTQAAKGQTLRGGRLRTGDIIEVHRDRDSFLAFRCDFFIGESARPRPPDQPFVVEEHAELARAGAACMALKASGA